MASVLKVDKFTGVTTAGSIDVVGEGNSTTTNLQQGLCKAWCNFNQATPAITDSFNISSVSDDSNGKHTISFSSNFGSTTYATSVYFRRNSDADAGGGYYGSNSTDTKTSSAMKFKAIYIDTSDQNLTDYTELCTHFLGDLA